VTVSCPATKAYWTLDPATRAYEPTRMKLAHSIKNKSGDEIAHSGLKLTLQILKAFEGQGQEIEVYNH